MKTIKLSIILIFTCIVTYGQQKQDDLLIEANTALMKKQTEQFLTILEKIDDVNMLVTIFPNTRFSNTTTLLHTASSNGNVIAVKAILAKGYLDINNNKNKMKTTPLCAISPITPEQRMKWTIDDYPKLVALAERDSVYRETIFKNTPKPSTNIADYPQPAEVAKILIEAGADVNRKDGGMATLLHRAIYDDNVALVKVLLNLKADPELRHGFNGKQFPTALHAAAIKGNSEIIKLLVAAGANTKAELKEYLITEEQMEKYGIKKFDWGNNIVTSFAKITHTPYTLAVFFKKYDAVNTFEELGVKK